jgi:hypothetical protein
VARRPARAHRPIATRKFTSRRERGAGMRFAQPEDSTTPRRFAMDVGRFGALEKLGPFEIL